jgi:hypothetical protein
LNKRVPASANTCHETERLLRREVPERQAGRGITRRDIIELLVSTSIAAATGRVQCQTGAVTTSALASPLSYEARSMTGFAGSPLGLYQQPFDLCETLLSAFY